MNSRHKQSIILGALTSSFGIFLAKAIGLLYASPFSIMATESNMVFYGNAYALYDIILNLCTAGIPFAIASMIAKYSDKGNYKTILTINKLSKLILLITGVVSGLILMLVSYPLSKFILGQSAPIQDVKVQQITFMFLALALATVPLLSGTRGFFQGFKNMKIYSFTQVFEQLVRVAFLLIASYILLYIFKLDKVYAVYMGILAASIAAIVTQLYLVKQTNIKLKEIKLLANQQEVKAISQKELFKEILYFGLPYLLIVLLGNSMSIVNSMFFLPLMENTGIEYAQSKLMLGIMQFNTTKIISIPQVLALGFSAGMVPYLTIAYENNDKNLLKRNITEILETVTFIALPLTFCLLVLSKPIYSLMYGNDNIELGSSILAYSSLVALVGTISPICTSMLTTLRMRKKVIIFLLITFITKFVLFIPFVLSFNYKGAIFSSVISSLVCIILCMITIAKKYRISFKNYIIRFIKMLFGLISMNGVFSILNMYLSFNLDSKLNLILLLAIYGILGIFGYLVTTACFNIPQRFIKKVLR